MKYHYRSRSYPYGFRTKPVGGFKTHLSDIVAMVCLTILLGVMIGIAGLFYMPVGV